MTLLRGGGQQGGQQPGGQSGRQVGDVPRGGLLPHAGHEVQQQGRGRHASSGRGPCRPVAGGTPRPGRGQASGRGAQKRQGGREVVQADQTGPQSGTAAVLKQRLALQQVAEAGEVQEKDIDAHAERSQAAGLVDG